MNLKKLVITTCMTTMTIMIFCITINIPDDYLTIQEGINVSESGDTVLVSPGTYFENINFCGKNIVVASYFILTQDIETIIQTIIDGSTSLNPDTTSTVIFCSGEDSSAVLKGFTITGGGGSKWIDYQIPNYLWFSGGGILIYMSAPVIQNNIIANNIVENNGNWSGASGGGLLSFRGNPAIINNVIRHNKSDYGCGVVADYTGAMIYNNIICKNTGGQQYGGGGVYVIGNDVNPVLIVNNSIVYNHSESTGGGIQAYSGSYSAINNIIWGNTQSSGGQINGGSTGITYSNVEGGVNNEGNIAQEPVFTDTISYYLQENSPCIDMGNPLPEYNDPEDIDSPGNAEYPAYGTLRNDMGAYGGPYSTFLIDGPTPINDELLSLLPFILKQNYPNPFYIGSNIRDQKKTSISFSLEYTDNVILEIFNILGEKIKTLVNKELPASTYSYLWDGKDDLNNEVAAGVYLYRLKTSKFSETKKLLLVK